MIRLFLLFCFSCLLVLSGQAQERVRNIRIRAVDSAQLEIRYDLIHAKPGDSVYFEMRSRLRGTLRILPEFVQGDWGANVPAGSDRRIIWDALANGYSLNEEVQARVFVRTNTGAVGTLSQTEPTQSVVTQAAPVSTQKPTSVPSKPASTNPVAITEPKPEPTSPISVTSTPVSSRRPKRAAPPRRSIFAPDSVQAEPTVPTASTPIPQTPTAQTTVVTQRVEPAKKEPAKPSKRSIFAADGVPAESTAPVASTPASQSPVAQTTVVTQRVESAKTEPLTVEPAKVESGTVGTNPVASDTTRRLKTRYAGPAWALLSAVAPGVGNIFVQMPKPKIGLRPLVAIGCYGLVAYGLIERQKSRDEYAIYEQQKNVKDGDPYYQTANEHYHTYWLATRGAAVVAVADVILTIIKGVRNNHIQKEAHRYQSIRIRPGLQAGQPTAVLRYTF
ncbi:hypothetical protein [Spirosoma aerolatum]|uniref:hypothetical protein n=1 Tax=Spirosoma aerolatum TaxID=1211326 RepID=UPI001FE392C7|nr:hypothetical protein [Spirosoma aerolatum]